MTTEIFRCVAGSRLFGTETPTSDTDYKAVHVPDARSILLGTADAVIDQSTGSNNSSNSADDVDLVSFPVRKYLKMLSKMETNAIEMLFAPSMLEGSFLWDQIREDRFKVMSANKQAFTGYAKGQAMRYAVRGDRITCLERLVTVLECLDPRERMNTQPSIISVLEDVDNVRVIHKPEADGPTPYITAFGRECPLTCFPKEAIKVYAKPLKEAGARTRAAAEGEGPDWKGLYHAQRIVDEGIELFSTGSLTFPCRDRAYYRRIREGKCPLDSVLGYFEGRLIELEELTPISDFMPKADQEWIDEFVYAVHEQAVVEAYEEWREAA